MMRRHRNRGRVLLTLLGALLGTLVAALFVVMLLPWRPSAGVSGDHGVIAPRADPTVDRCAACHHRSTPGIVDQWASSRHGIRGVTCRSCHEVDEDDPYAIEHIGTYVSPIVTPRVCGQCHPSAVEEYERSRHSLPAWASLNGTADFEHDEELMALWESREDTPDVNGDLVLPRRADLYEIEGPEITELACQRCHEIGRPNLDGSVGLCSKCHLRHRFDLEQVRRPETCNSCHSGDDQPQWDIYTESAHGVIYQTQTEMFNFHEHAGRITVDDFPAPTCQLCHMSGFGGLHTTHDVGERLAWYLHRPIAQHRPDHEGRRRAMREVCRQCHSTDFITLQFDAGDTLVEWTNERIGEANDILRGLMDDGLIPREPFSHPLHHAAFDLWRHGGRTARFAALMQGAGHTQWGGIYPLLRAFSELEHQAEELRGMPPATSAEEASPGG